MPIEIAPRATTHSQLRADCKKCSLESLCLPHGMTLREIEELANDVEDAGDVDAPLLVFEPGQTQKYVYAVRAGTFKSYTITSDGTENILGFHLPGELFGLDALHTDSHQCFAAAVGPAELCRLPVSKIDSLSERLPPLRRQLLTVLSRDFQRQSLFGQNYCARQGVISFLIDLSQRLRERGYQKNTFELSMTRKDIANFLRVTPETVSREFSKLRKQGIIETKGKALTVLNREALYAEP